MTLQDDVRKLEEDLRGLAGIEPKKKAEILGLIESIKSRASDIVKAHIKVSDLAQSLKTFEGVHPKLLGTIDDIGRLLSEIGI